MREDRAEVWQIGLDILKDRLLMDEDYPACADYRLSVVEERIDILAEWHTYGCLPAEDTPDDVYVKGVFDVPPDDIDCLIVDSLYDVCSQIWPDGRYFPGINFIIVSGMALDKPRTILHEIVHTLWGSGHTTTPFNIMCNICGSSERGSDYSADQAGLMHLGHPGDWDSQ